MSDSEHSSITSAAPTTSTLVVKDEPAFYEKFLDAGVIPDYLLRFAIRQLLKSTALSFAKTPLDKASENKKKYISEIKNLQQIALNTKEANEQHYEVPTAFFQTHLGPRMKYSSAFYNYENIPSPKDGVVRKARTLAQAEIAMLELYVQRANIIDGMSILELGCGWGSLTLFLAENFPNSRVTAISNSHSQREHILAAARSKNLTNLEIITADMNIFQFEEVANGKRREFDRIISIEMFEHMKNYQVLFAKVSQWLVPETGRLFVHVFCHKDVPYDFKTAEDDGKDSWMARYFFTGGTMPSVDLFMWFQDHLKVIDRWTVDGRNYGQTSNHWLENLDAKREESLKVLIEAYGSKELGTVWFNRWRIFYLSVAELFNFNNGQEWPVVHYLFTRR
ncbi:hypothetical protein HK100_008998 [Physocladia obscura]|uniref:S-adenosyl-L-methionine-dependent methyltransferase n=1 Tax=Physocladia obscura TaxID=109957 RepID=A0AAD5T6G0_9FUNG|nr:hypothetical protein HK100_008998 [Physocladia obscura]